MIAQPSTVTVVMDFELPLPCATCGLPADWFAAGVSGCPNCCGATTTQQRLDARDALLRHRAQRSVRRSMGRGYADRHPVGAGPSTRRPELLAADRRAG